LATPTELRMTEAEPPSGCAGEGAEVPPLCVPLPAVQAQAPSTSLGDTKADSPPLPAHMQGRYCCHSAGLRAESMSQQVPLEALSTTLEQEEISLLRMASCLACSRAEHSAAAAA
jgi:hypothetical protein